MTQGHQLQCPDCGDRHDLDALGDVETFRCRGCGRALKVPLQIRTAREMAEAPAPKSPADQGLIAGPSKRVARKAPGRVPLARSTVALWLRLVVWIAAVPFGLVVVFGGAYELKWVTLRQLEDTFTKSGWDRFAPVAKLLPIAALIAATIVQLLVSWLERKAAAREPKNPSASGGLGADMSGVEIGRAHV